jgi:hypothetical protein
LLQQSLQDGLLCRSMWTVRLTLRAGRGSANRLRPDKSSYKLRRSCSHSNLTNICIGLPKCARKQFRFQKALMGRSESVCDCSISFPFHGGIEMPIENVSTNSKTNKHTNTNTRARSTIHKHTRRRGGLVGRGGRGAGGWANEVGPGRQSMLVNTYSKPICKLKQL